MSEQTSPASTTETFYRIEWKQGEQYSWLRASEERYTTQAMAIAMLNDKRGRFGLWKRNAIYRIVRVEETVTEV